MTGHEIIVEAIGWISTASFLIRLSFLNVSNFINLAFLLQLPPVFMPIRTERLLFGSNGSLPYFFMFICGENFDLSNDQFPDVCPSGTLEFNQYKTYCWAPGFVSRGFILNE